MATRRSRMTVNNKYTQALKLGLGRLVVISNCCDYLSLLLSKRHKPKPAPNHILWAKFKSYNFEGIDLVSFLEDVSSSSCVFNVFRVSDDNLWTEALVSSLIGVQSGDKFISEDLSLDLSGSEVFAIESIITRLGVTYKKKIYLNHLGVFESLIRLRNYAEFLDVTKGDE